MPQIRASERSNQSIASKVVYKWCSSCTVLVHQVHEIVVNFVKNTTLVSEMRIQRTLRYYSLCTINNLLQ